MSEQVLEDRLQRLFGSKDIEQKRLQDPQRVQLADEELADSFAAKLGQAEADPKGFAKYATVSWRWRVTKSEPRELRPRRTNLAASTCIGLARKLVQSGRVRIARQYLHEVIDDSLHCGQFATVDALLFSSDPSSDDVRILITLLTATKPAKDRLRLRADFFSDVTQAVNDRNLNEPGLLEGLE